jgi:hypothetical protein
VLGAAGVRDLLGVGALVEDQLEAVDGRQVEPARERHQPRNPPARRRDDRRRVHATGEEAPERDVADQLTLDPRLERGANPLDPLAFADGLVGLELEIPVAPRFVDPLRGTQQVTSGKHPHALEQRSIRVDVLEREVLPEGVGRDARAQARGKQGFDLGAEQQPAADLRVIERLHTEAVAHERQRSLELVPDGEGEHAVEPVQARGAPFLPRPQHDLGVAARAEGLAACVELARQLAEVVELAVVDEHVTAVLARHRLVTRVGHVEDREAVVGEADGTADVGAAVVRAAMGDRDGHRVDLALRHALAAQVEDARDPAHQAGASARTNSDVPAPSVSTRSEARTRKPVCRRSWSTSSTSKNEK